MPNIKYGAKIHEGIENISVPLADGSGDAVFRYGASNANELELLMLNEITEFSSNKPVSLKSNLFQHITSIVKISVPNATRIDGYNFYGCTGLTYLDVGKPDSLANVFIGSHKMETIILRKSDSITTLNSSITSNSKNLLDGVTLIYVPRALIDTYKTSTNWSLFANQFRVLEDYTVDGTVTGAFDESKL